MVTPEAAARCPVCGRTVALVGAYQAAIAGPGRLTWHRVNGRRCGGSWRTPERAR